MLVAAAQASHLTPGLWTAMSALAMALSAIAAIAVFLADRRAKRRSSDRSDAEGDARLMEVERQGWEMLLTNLQAQYSAAQQSLMEAQEALDRTRLELRKTQERLRQVERRLADQEVRR